MTDLATQSASPLQHDLLSVTKVCVCVRVSVRLLMKPGMSMKADRNTKRSVLRNFQDLSIFFTAGATVNLTLSAAGARLSLCRRRGRLRVRSPETVKARSGFLKLLLQRSFPGVQRQNLALLQHHSAP